jgi:hypothetical protein
MVDPQKARVEIARKQFAREEWAREATAMKSWRLHHAQR